MADQASILVVANRTAESPSCSTALQERTEAGPCAFTLLVPATPARHRVGSRHARRRGGGGATTARPSWRGCVGRVSTYERRWWATPTRWPRFRTRATSHEYDELIVSTLPLKAVEVAAARPAQQGACGHRAACAARGGQRGRKTSCGARQVADRARAYASQRSSSATHSMCGVCGNMSTGRTVRSRSPRPPSAGRWAPASWGCRTRRRCARPPPRACAARPSATGPRGAGPPPPRRDFPTARAAAAWPCERRRRRSWALSTPFRRAFSIASATASSTSSTPQTSLASSASTVAIVPMPQNRSTTCSRPVRRGQLRRRSRRGAPPSRCSSGRTRRARC